MNARSWFIDGRIRLMTMSFSNPATLFWIARKELGHAAGRELADQRVLAEATRHAVHAERVASRRPTTAVSQRALEATTGPGTSKKNLVPGEVLGSIERHRRDRSETVWRRCSGNEVLHLGLVV